MSWAAIIDRFLLQAPAIIAAVAALLNHRRVKNISARTKRIEKCQADTIAKNGAPPQ